jgi:hypothetical protein
MTINPLTNIPYLGRQKFIVDQVIPLSGNLPASLLQIQKGTEGYARGLPSRGTINEIKWKFPTAENMQKPQSADAAAVPRTEAVGKPPGGTPALQTQPTNSLLARIYLRIRRVFKGAKPGVLIAGGTVHFMTFTDNMTEAQVIHGLGSVGIKGAEATKSADKILNFLHSRGLASALFGLAVGGVVAALLGTFWPSIDKQLLFGIIGVVALIAAILFQQYVVRASPFVGKWSLGTAESRYEMGDVPRTAICTISQPSTGFEVDENAVLSDGKSRHVTFVLEPDGNEHPAPNGTGADTTVTTLMDNKLETTYMSKKEVTRRETRVLSSDQKEMTVTLILRTRTGSEVKNVSVYERK